MLPVKELLGQRVCYVIDSAYCMKEVVQHPLSNNFNAPAYKFLTVLAWKLKFVLSVHPTCASKASIFHRNLW